MTDMSDVQGGWAGCGSGALDPSLCLSAAGIFVAGWLTDYHTD